MTTDDPLRQDQDPAAVAEDVRQVVAFALRREVRGEVGFDPGSRHLHATDASNYRHVPAGVVAPRDVDDLLTTLRVCREHRVPVTVRGAGTSLAGQATNRGVIVDVSRHLTAIADLDPDARTVRVEPGVVLADLQRAAAPAGLRFGPDPSTTDRCTLGGMIGNDACGVRSLVWGRTCHNVEALDVVTGDGVRLTVGRHTLDEAARLAARDDRVGELFRGLLALRSEVGDLVRDRFPDVPRRVSGIALDQLLHDDHLDVAKALVGTEGTCVTVLGATVRLVPVPAARVQVVLAYPDLLVAADHVPALLRHGLTGLEGIDDVLAAGAARPGRPRPRGLDLLPAGGGWLVAELSADTPEAALAAAEDLVADGAALGAPAARIVTDPVDQAAVWRVRADGLGAVTVAPGRAPMLGGWEDAGLAPDQLGSYLRGMTRLLERHGLEAAVYGHFGDGCMHTKISFDHTTPAGRATFRAFVEDAADLVVAHGGSPSGEHGDGQARSELHTRVFGPELVDAFRRFARLWDPTGLLNPGRLIDPRPLDADLRAHDAARTTSPTTWFALPADGGDLQAAASRCVGIGACRREQPVGTMCPSYRATREERHSTRGRARLLFEVLRSDAGLDGADEDDLVDALSLCLSCKACANECPTGVDVATYKAEVLARRHADRRRPLEHHALGRIRTWARLATSTPSVARAVNAVAASPVAAAAARVVGVSADRPPPAFATQTFSRWWRRRGGTRGTGPPVLLFVDTFTEHLHPHVARAAVAVLEAAGHRVTVPARPVCCGRPRYDHGMLDEATAELRQLAATLGPVAAAGIPIVGLEPSCVAALRDELPQLLDGDPSAAAIAASSRTLAEHLRDTGWSPPSDELAGTTVALHGHCHQGALWGTAADVELLRRAGAEVDAWDVGCCGLAGSFGYRADAYDVSVAIGEDRFAPAVRAAAAAGRTVVADGSSCRWQADHLTGPAGSGPSVPPRHLAEVLADLLPAGRSSAGGPPRGSGPATGPRSRAADV